jgi:peptide-methionine (S)-S-oxide reductase
MKSLWFRGSAGRMLAVFGFVIGSGLASGEGQISPLPDPQLEVAAPPNTRQTAVFAGGCFWGVEAVFRHVAGVISSTSGYAGGEASAAQYERVSTGTTGHAESVRVVFDPAKVSYAQLLKVFFSVAHDPTQLNRQGPDTGSQYRSEIFTTNEEQVRAAKAYIAQLDAAKVYKRPIVTLVAPLRDFYAAEDYHQNYLALHPTEPYIVHNDLPKLVNLKSGFPTLYRGD